MTLGERIKYFRKEAGFTQSELASRANLHPVSIRKYETDKMKPQLAQIEKIADALNISSNIIIGLEYSNLKLKTVGDFMAIFCMLLNTEKLLIEGERGEDGFIKSETLCIRVKDNSITEEILNFEKINPEETASQDHQKAVAQRMHLENALAGLSTDQQGVLDLRIIKGYSVAETARLIGKTEAAVRTTQYRALQALAQILDGHD